MPAPEKKISSHNDPCEIKLACSVEVTGPTSASVEIDPSVPCRGGKQIITEAEEAQAVLNREPCPEMSQPACQLARPSISPTTTKPGAIDYEICEEDNRPDQKKIASCPDDYEDCKDFKDAEKRRVKLMRDEARKRKREEAKNKNQNKCT